MKRIAADSTASLHDYFKYLLVVVIFRNEVNCRGGEEEKLIWPGEEEIQLRQLSLFRTDESLLLNWITPRTFSVSLTD